MHDLALESLHAVPVRRVALGMPVVALAHPQEVRGETHRLSGVAAHRHDRPEVVLAGPACRGDLVAIADVAAEIVLLDHLAHVAHDLGGRRDRSAAPWLEAIAEGVQVAVGTDARIAMGEPRAAEARLRFQDDEPRPGALLRQVVGTPDTGDTCPDDQDVEVLGFCRGSLGQYLCVVHDVRSSVLGQELHSERCLREIVRVATRDCGFASG